MGRIAYVNGRFTPHADAAVHIEDRGFQFGDSIYEVWAVFGGRLADEDGHFERLARSLGELRIAQPMTRASLALVIRRVLARNLVSDGLVYLQVSRGVAPRDHPFPDPPPRPSVVITAKSVDLEAAEARASRGVAVITTPETRWGRCDIKTTNLLPNVLAKQAAREAGAVEAWFVDELGLVTEGGSSNAWIVDADGVLRTTGHPGQHPARSHAPLAPRPDRGERRRVRGAGLHRGGGAQRPRSLHHRRRQPRSACGQARRRTDRRGCPRPGGEAPEGALYLHGATQRRADARSGSSLTRVAREPTESGVCLP